jgi:preprotein translocase subunit SecY
MLKFIETLKNIWTIEELRNRILITLLFLAVYRLGAQVVLPGVIMIFLQMLRLQVMKKKYLNIHIYTKKYTNNII